GDGLVDGDEVTAGTDPLLSDSDGDGLSDGDEVHIYSTSPLNTDTDSDGLTDDLEVSSYGTNPNLVDSDYDGLSDRDEVTIHLTDPLHSDSDGDSFSDSLEITNGGDPLASDLWRVDYIRDNNEVYDLYPSNSVLDISIGQAGFSVSNNTAWLWLQLEQSSDLDSWMTAGDAVLWSIPVDSSNAFYRVRSHH
ncbi:binary toxin-like calcium binding domain-containing protein, partial [Pontiella agarivorans]